MAKYGQCKVSLMRRNQPIEGFNGFSMHLLKQTFGEVVLIHDANQFNDMNVLARRQIRNELCTSSSTNSIPICIEFQLKNQFLVEKYLLSAVGRIDVLTSMCGRHVPHCAIAYDTLYFPLARFSGLDKLESTLPLLQEDGLLHVVASDIYRYEFSDYLLPELEQVDRAHYRRLCLYNEKTRTRSYMLVGRRVPMRIIALYFSLCCDYEVVPLEEAYPLI